jgi:N6-adenosine-specific RNA methylase IME4
MNNLIPKSWQQSLALLEAGKQALAQAKMVEDVKEIRDQAQAVQHYLKQRGMSTEAAQDAAEIKLWAERRLGEMLAKIKTSEGGNFVLPPGVVRINSSKWQRIESVPQEDFERYIAEARGSGELPTTAGVLHLAKVKAKKKKRSNRTPLVDSCTVDDLSRLVVAGKTFGTIYADPPWKYDNQGTRASTDNHYDTMTVEEIAALPIVQLAAEECHLHLWTTSSFLEEAITLLKCWGFQRKQEFIWVKPQMGIGNYWRSSHETMLLGVKGGLTFPPSNVKSWLSHGRTKHSAKPPVVRKLIEQMSPAPRLELFGRQCVDGWTVWGNQIRREFFEPFPEV